jgi:AcrR family transcriptional regulator
MTAPRDATPARRRVPNRRGHGERLRADLVEAASQLLEELDSEDALSLRAVARHANVAPQSVYLHFTDKKALLSAVFEVRFADLIHELESAASTAADRPPDRLRAICRAYCAYALRHPGHYRVLFGTCGTPGWLLEEMHGMTALSLLEEAVRACGDSAERDVVPVTICLWAGLHGLVTLRRDRPSFPWPDFDELIDTLIHGAIGSGPDRRKPTQEHNNRNSA